MLWLIQENSSFLRLLRLKPAVLLRYKNVLHLSNKNKSEKKYLDK